MIRIGILGEIGSGKSFVSKQIGFPVFNADIEIAKLYKSSRKCYLKLKKTLPNYVKSFPIKKHNLLKAIKDNQHNLRKIIKIMHPEIRLKMNTFIKKNKNKKIVVLDIPLLLENKINKKNDVLIFIQANKKEMKMRLKDRPHFDDKLFKKLKNLQLGVEVKKKKSNFIIKNNFNKNFVKKNVKKVVKEILLND
jgi:dephospho-CoA kinase